MPSPYVRDLSRQTNKSQDEIEKLWNKAKQITSEEFGTDEENFGDQEYSYAVSIVKNMVGIDEAVLNPTDFLNSERDARAYIEAVTSGNFEIGNVVPPDDDGEEEEGADNGGDADQRDYNLLKPNSPGFEQHKKNVGELDEQQAEQLRGQLSEADNTEETVDHLDKFLEEEKE